MKKIVLTAFAIGIMSCASQKQLETKNIPFEIGQSNVQEWSGGRAESGSGTTIEIIVSEVDDLAFEKIYFRSRALECELKSENTTHRIIGSYKRGANMEDTNEEGKMMQKTFQLSPSEAVLAYRNSDGNLKYVKVTDIKEKKPLILMERPKN